LGRFFFMCYPGGLGTDGAPCDSVGDCAIGYGGYANGTSDVCFKNCNVQTGACPSLQLCFALTDASDNPVIVDGYELGVCQSVLRKRMLMARSRRVTALAVVFALGAGGCAKKNEHRHLRDEDSATPSASED